MKLPPENEKGANKSASDDPWDSVLGDKKEPTMTPDLAHKLLEMNPELRKKGASTGWVVNQAQKAALKGKRATATPEPASKSGDVFAKIDELKQRVQKEQERLRAEIQRLKDAEAAVKIQARDDFVRWLIDNDPDARSPIVQQVLADEKNFLDGVGFSIRYYIDEKKRSGR